MNAKTAKMFTELLRERITKKQEKRQIKCHKNLIKLEIKKIKKAIEKTVFKDVQHTVDVRFIPEPEVIEYFEKLGFTINKTVHRGCGISWY